MASELRDWLAGRWVVAAGFMAAALLAVSPVLALPLPVFLIFLHGPVYMLHQVEEHAGERFRRFANERLFGGRDVLTVTAILVVNLPLVWGVNLLCLYLASAFGAAWGLTAAYLVLVNALAHVATAIRFRGPNPGLATGLLLFLPLGIATVASIGRTGGILPHAVGLAFSVAIHAAIAATVIRRRRALASGHPVPARASA